MILSKQYEEKGGIAVKIH